MPQSAASRPDINFGQKQTKSFRRQLIVHELLAVTARPKDVPSGSLRCGTRLGYRVLCLELCCFNQGFAPFNPSPFPGIESTSEIPVITGRQPL